MLRIFSVFGGRVFRSRSSGRLTRRGPRGGGEPRGRNGAVRSFILVNKVSVHYFVGRTIIRHRPTPVVAVICRPHAVAGVTSSGS